MRNASTILVVEPQKKRFLVSREDNIKIDSNGKMCKDVDRIYLGQNRDQWQNLLTTVMKFRIV
jgi:hypothetical protein